MFLVSVELLQSCLHLCAETQTLPVSMFDPGWPLALQSSEAPWLWSTRRSRRRSKLPKRPMDTVGSLEWRRTGWTRFANLMCLKHFLYFVLYNPQAASCWSWSISCIQVAVGHDYVAQVEHHSSQKDAAKGFGGKFGVQKDRVDKVRR